MFSRSAYFISKIFPCDTNIVDFHHHLEFAFIGMFYKYIYANLQKDEDEGSGAEETTKRKAVSQGN